MQNLPRDFPSAASWVHFNESLHCQSSAMCGNSIQKRLWFSNNAEYHECNHLLKFQLCAELGADSVRVQHFMQF